MEVFFTLCDIFKLIDAICPVFFNLHFMKNEGLWTTISISFIFTISLNMFQSS